jgi:hypothetical protein
MYDAEFFISSELCVNSTRSAGIFFLHSPALLLSEEREELHLNKRDTPKKY